ncbi:MAG TPA: TadE/TadG family type IV pilus assembly protein [Actinomycetota bacterium]|nr:TadE/TadG family type IV pilus assembly protein [Actinomycetota bacterium]
MCRWRDTRGSVSVEFAAVLPLVAVSLLLVAQIGLLVSEQLAVQHAAREGAREAAVWNDDSRARDAVLRAGNLDPARTTIVITPAQREVGTPVRVEVRYTPVEMPVVGRFMPASTTLRATVEMRTERAPPDAG